MEQHAEKCRLAGIGKIWQNVVPRVDQRMNDRRADEIEITLGNDTRP